MGLREEFENFMISKLIEFRSPQITCESCSEWTAKVFNCCCQQGVLGNLMLVEALQALFKKSLVMKKNHLVRSPWK